MSFKKNAFQTDYEYQELSFTLLGQSDDLLKNWLPGGHDEGKDYVALNPTRHDRNKGCFRINQETGEWIDFATDDKGRDLIYLYGYLNQIPYSEAVKKLKKNNETSYPTFVHQETENLASSYTKGIGIDKKEKMLQMAQNIWQSAHPIPGSLSEKYLRSRGIRCKLPKSLSHADSLLHAPTNTNWPCMIAPILEWPNFEFIGIHRTYINHDGSGKASIEPNKMILGHSKGGAIQLGDDLSQLIIAEGIETGLSVYQVTGWTVWVALSAQNIVNLILPPPNLTQTIIIAADSDRACQLYSEKASIIWVAAGYRVKIAIPSNPYKDFNDLLRGI